MKKLTLKEFVSKAAPDDCRIFHVGEGHWEVRCKEGALVQPSGKTEFDDLPHLLSILAGVGIRCCDIEWDGLPTRQVEAEISTESVTDMHLSMLEAALREAEDELCALGATLENEGWDTMTTKLTLDVVRIALYGGAGDGQGPEHFEQARNALKAQRLAEEQAESQEGE